MPFIQLQFRRELSTTWRFTNPVLAAGEMGIESDTDKFKIGNGSTHWNNLPYDTGPTGINGGTVSQSIIPDTDNIYDLGSSNYRFRSIYVGPNSLHIGSTILSADPVTGSLTVINPIAGTTGQAIGPTGPTGATGVRGATGATCLAGFGTNSGDKFRFFDEGASQGTTLRLYSSSPSAPKSAVIQPASASMSLALMPNNGNSGNVGINNLTPQYPLDVSGSVNITGNMYLSNVASVYSGGTQAVTINSSGFVGIGVSAPQYNLDIGGSLNITGNATKPGGGSWSATSDRRIKTNIVQADLQQCYSTIQSIPLYHYKFIDDYYTKYSVNDTSMLGFIAQDVATVFPKAVTQISSMGYSDLLQLDYTQVQMAHYGATKLLMSTMEAQGIQIATLTSTVQALMANH